MQNTTYVTTFMIACALLFAPGAFAQSQSGATAPAAKSDKGDGKVDISDLENKYWAPKDTDFSVVQNRTYSKSHSLFLSLEYGMPINDSYSTGSLYALTGNYFFNERYGIQVTGILADLHNNQETNDMVNYGSGVQPDHGRMKNYLGVGFDYVPFYAKMSFLGKKIIYFDMAITPTIGSTTYEQIERDSSPTKSAFTYGFDITQYFFFSNWFAIRADLKNQWYSQDVVKYYNTGSQKEGDSVGTKQIQDSLFLLGVTFYF